MLQRSAVPLLALVLLLASSPASNRQHGLLHAAAMSGAPAGDDADPVTDLARLRKYAEALDPELIQHAAPGQALCPAKQSCVLPCWRASGSEYAPCCCMAARLATALGRWQLMAHRPLVRTHKQPSSCSDLTHTSYFNDHPCLTLSQTPSTASSTATHAGRTRAGRCAACRTPTCSAASTPASPRWLSRCGACEE